MHLHHLSRAEPAGRGLPRERRRGRRERKAAETRPPAGRGNRGEAALGAARPPPSGRAALHPVHGGLPGRTQSRRLRRTARRPPPAPGRDPAARPGTPGAAPSAPSEGPPAPGSAGATGAASAALDHAHGFPSLNAEQVSCRRCAAGGRADAAETPAAGTPAPRCPRRGAPRCSLLASATASGVPLGAPRSWPSSESSRGRARGTFAGCGPFSRPQAGAG